MGDAAGYATIGIIDKYRDEFEYFIEHKRSRLDGRLEVPPAAQAEASAAGLQTSMFAQTGADPATQRPGGQA